MDMSLRHFIVRNSRHASIRQRPTRPRPPFSSSFPRFQCGGIAAVPTFSQSFNTSYPFLSCKTFFSSARIQHPDDNPSLQEQQQQHEPMRRRILDGNVIRKEIKQWIHSVADNNNQTDENATTSVALQIKFLLIDLVDQAARYRLPSDGELAQRALDAVVLHPSRVLLKSDPALAAEITCLTIQSWCNCGHPDGLQKAETLLWMLLHEHDVFLSDKLQTNTDIYNDCLATLLSAITKKWPRSSQLPPHVRERIDPIIKVFTTLVQDKSIRLDWATFGINQILYVCLKTARTDDALKWLQTFNNHQHSDNDLRPNITTYNTVLQTLSLKGCVAEIEAILRQMTANCKRQRQGESKQPVVVPNHFSVMPWISAFCRLPNHHPQRHRAGQGAQQAWFQVQEWHDRGLVDLTAIRETHVWVAIAKAWAHAYHACKHNKSKGSDNVRKLLELWKQAVIDSSSTGSADNCGIATPSLASVVLSVLDPVKDLEDKINPILDQIDFMMKRMSRPSSREEWTRLYQETYGKWMHVDGAALSAHALWSRLDAIDPESAVQALKLVDQKSNLVRQGKRDNTSSTPVSGLGGKK